MTTTVLLRGLPDSQVPPLGISSSPDTERLGLILASLKSRPNHREIQHAIQALDEQQAQATAYDPDTQALIRAILGKLVVAVYAEALDGSLLQAGEIEAEADWWADIERSRTKVALYLIQSNV